MRKQQESRQKYGCNVPWAILMDPTSACNLHCTGCWAAEYGNRLNMSYEELDSIVDQANELGTYFFLYSGGEPLVRKGDIIRLCEAHPDCQFTAFTNGTLIDEAFADEMLRVKNFIPAISVEGFEQATDFRRGSGTFAQVERAMAILKERRLPFGISCCLRPCPLLDNPDALVNAVERSGAHSTELRDPEPVRDLTAKCEDAAAAWAPVADEIWAGKHGGAGARG